MSDPVLGPDPDSSASRIAGSAESTDENDRSGRSTGSTADSSRRWLLISALLSGALAAVIAWGFGETKILAARAKHEQFMSAGHQIDWSTPDTRRAAERVTSTRLHAVFGGLLGLLLGIAGGIARRSMGSAIVAGLVGAGLGAFLGSGSAYLVLPVYARYRQMNDSDLLGSLLLHSALWTGIGAAGGLALGLGLGGRWRPIQAAVAGLLGALAGILIFEVLGALVFPLEETGSPTSTTARTRLLARLLVAVPSAVAAAMVASQTPVRASTTERI